MQENRLAAGAQTRTPLGSLQRSPDPLAGGEGAALRKNPTHALGPSGLQPWSFGPRSLHPQIHLPKSAYDCDHKVLSVFKQKVSRLQVHGEEVQ